jgi:hypothetical protein
MARKKPGKPKSPEEIAAERIAKRARDFDAVNIQPEAAALEAQDDIAVTHAERTKVDGARRMDAFEALKPEMAKKNPGAYDAARRLERDMAIRMDEADRGQRMERVDCDAFREALQRRIEAGERVDAVLAGVGERDAWLLQELIRPTLIRRDIITRPDQGPPITVSLKGWRAIVAYVTGEDNPVAQAAAVRSACANLAASYRALDEKQRIAA